MSALETSSEQMQTLAPTWKVSQSTTAAWYVRLFPSLNDVAFLLPIVVLFARMKGTQLLFSDGDTGWHIRTGEWILANHGVPKVDLFSYTKPGAAWFAWEWAWDLLAAILHRYAGLAGLGFVTSIMLGVFCVLVYQLSLRASHNNVTSIAVTATTAAASSIHWLARPHLVSWLMTAGFLLILESNRSKQSPSNRALLLALPILMVFWTNMHGGFVAGLMLVGSYALGETITATVSTSDLRFALKSSVVYWKSLLLCAAATLINPYGWQLHTHIVAYLGDSELLDKIQEFQSISFHAGPAIFFEIMLLLAVLSVYEGLRRRQFTPVLLLCAWAHLSLQSARHIPLFAIVSAPFSAALLSSAVERAREIPVLKSVAASLSDIFNDLRAMEVTPRVHLLSAAALMVIAGLFAIGQPPFAGEFNPETFPVQAIPVLQRSAGNRIFTTDQWGDYILYRLYPIERAFFDGRSDFYGNDFVKINQRIGGAEHDWKALLKRYAVNLVVLKPETPLSAVLKLTPQTRVLFDDGKVIVFDIRGIYQNDSSQLLSKGESTKRVSGASQVQQSALPPAASSLTRYNNSQKGKTS